jgi:anti-anti-sigma factor
LQVARTATGYLVRVEGRATAIDGAALRTFVTDSFKESPQEAVALDLRQCAYVDSTFLGCLVALHRHGFATAGPRFSIVADEPTRKRLLSATRLDHVLSLIDVEPPAIGGFIMLNTPRLDPAEFGRQVMESHRVLAEIPGDQARTFREVADQLARELEDRHGCAQ